MKSRNEITERSHYIGSNGEYVKREQAAKKLYKTRNCKFMNGLNYNSKLILKF